MISFFVPGEPIPKGSAKAFMVRGRAVITHANKRTKPWERAIVEVAAWQKYERDRDAPFGVELDFFMPRPKSHQKQKNAVKYPSLKRCDLDKAVRAVLDALTVARVWVDDSRVVSLYARKQFALPMQGIGVAIKVTEIQ